MSNKVLIGLAALALVVGATLLANSKLTVSLSPSITKTVTTYPLAFQTANPTTSNNEKKIYRLKLPAEQVVIIAGEIGAETVSAAAAIDRAASNNAPVFVLISSPGGSILDGATIINAMEASRVPVYTVCMDICASMAAIIHQYGTERLMADRSVLMFHDAAGQFEGYFPHIKARFDAFERYVARFNLFISERVGVSLLDFEAMEHKNLWIDSEDALAKKMAEKIVHVEIFNDNKAVDIKSLLKKGRGAFNKVNSPVTPNIRELKW
jgi:ATP-dependent Clp protease protease subunit